MIADSGSYDDNDITSTTCTGGVGGFYSEAYILPMEKEVEEEDILPERVDVLKAIHRDISRSNKFSSKSRFRTHRVVMR